MKNINSKEYWNYFLGFISSEFDQGIFDLIIKPNVFKSFKNGVFTLVSSTETVKKLINTQFKNRLEVFIHADSGQKVEINAILKDDVQDFGGFGFVGTTENQQPLKIVEKEKNSSVIEMVSDKFLEEMKPLNHNFSDFVVGKSNKIAFSSATNFVDSQKDNVLFLYGDSGVGKSHLLSSVGNKAIEKGNRVGYMTAADFVEFYTASLGHFSSVKNSFGSVDEFVGVLNTLDLLIIDDVQYFVGKTSSIDTFFDVFEYLQKRGKKIAVASDMPPKALNDIPERLKTRFSSGGTTKIYSPGSELAKKYLEKEFKKEFIENAEFIITNDVYDVLVYHFGSDFRSLQGVVRKLGMAVTINPTNIVDMPYVTKNVLDEPITKEKIKGSEIQRVVCGKYMIEKAQLLGKGRKKEVKDARHLAIYLYRKRLDYSYKEIGSVFGGRDHSTVMHSEKMVIKKMGEDRVYKDFVLSVEKEIFN